MKKIYEFRVRYDNAHLLFSDEEGINIGTSVRIIRITEEDERFKRIGILQQELQAKKEFFFAGWRIIYRYTKDELDNAILFNVNIRKTFEPAGEQCGTVYDESTACGICGANAKQIGPLKLKTGSIPKTDIALTIADEVVVTERLRHAFNQRGLKGAEFDPVPLKEAVIHFQLNATAEFDLSPGTIAGGDPFKTIDASPGGEYYIQGYKFVNPPQVFKCPLGHTIGANLLSEVHVLNSTAIGGYDFMASKQKIGVRRGVLRQSPIYVCSPAFRKMVIEEKLTGFDFEIAYIDKAS